MAQRPISQLEDPSLIISRAQKSKSDKKGFTLPAFSTQKVAVPLSEEERQVEYMRKKMMRRHAPVGENRKRINEILKSIKKEKPITVQEFIALIAPSTADNGALLRSVFNADMITFKKMASKVYEMIAQDHSDVLLNQQMDVADFYRSKKHSLHHRMMNTIEEIFRLAPKFNFERYCKEKDIYLAELFPVPVAVSEDPEDLEMMRRQAAYHRLEWLRSEGERLNEENSRLKAVAQKMRIEQAHDQKFAALQEAAAERHHDILEATEAEKQETFEQLSDVLEKSMIEKERDIRIEADKDLHSPLPPASSKKSPKQFQPLRERRSTSPTAQRTQRSGSPLPFVPSHRPCYEK